MTSELRKQNLENFIESQKYLTGMRYRVVIDEAKDTIAVEFEKLGEDNYERLRVALKVAMMRHVRVEVLKMMASERKSKQKTSTKSNGYEKR